MDKNPAAVGSSINVAAVNFSPLLMHALVPVMAQEGLNIVDEDFMTATKLDLIILNVPGPSFADVPSFRDSHSPKIVVISPPNLIERYLHLMLSQRIGAIVNRDEACPQLCVDTFRVVLSGGTVLPIDAIAKLVTSSRTVRPPDWLSEAHVEMLLLLAGPTTLSQVSQQRHVSERTAVRETQELFRLMGVQRRHQAIALAERWGLLSNAILGIR